MNDPSELFAAEWSEHIGRLHKVLEEVQSYVEYVCSRLRYERFRSSAPGDFRFRFVDQGRVKTPASIFEKIKRYSGRYSSPWDMDDLVGLRVVVISPRDTIELAEAVSNDVECPMQDVTYQPIESRVGYRAHHLTGWFRKSNPPVGCEIQIRTELQDLWAVFSEYDLYKKDEVGAVSGEAASISEELERLDFRIQEAREKLRPRVPPATEFSDLPTDTEND